MHGEQHKAVKPQQKEIFLEKSVIWCRRDKLIPMIDHGSAMVL